MSCLYPASTLPISCLYPAPSPASTRNQVEIPPPAKKQQGNDSQASGLSVQDFLKGSGLTREDILNHLQQ